MAGADVFLIQTNNQTHRAYNEKRVGFRRALGYDFNEHLRQVWTYSLVGRTVYNVQSSASLYVRRRPAPRCCRRSARPDHDHRDSRIDPHTGYLISLGTDFAGIGGNAHFVRTKSAASISSRWTG